MNIKSMKQLCKASKASLAKNIVHYLGGKGYKNIYYTSDYIIAEGTLPICLLAHLDTVFNHIPHEFIYDSKKEVLWAPGGAGFDDRTGVYLILQCINTGYYPSVIFTDMEEVGGFGAKSLTHKFPQCPFKDCRALIQLDRMGHKDAVFYNCDNEAFEKYICSFGFEVEVGSFSDISVIAPAWEIAAVNLSVGYMDEHTGTERLYCKWTEQTFNKIINILKRSPQMKSYAYIPFVYKYNQNNLIYCYNNKCVICGEPLFDSHLIDDTIWGGDSYCVCGKCYNEYYNDIPYETPAENPLDS